MISIASTYLLPSLPLPPVSFITPRSSSTRPAGRHLPQSYHVVKETKKHWLATSTIPDQCKTWNTGSYKKWINGMEALSIQLKSLVKNAKERGSSLENLPSWIQKWSSPWKGKTKGGYLVPEGEDDLYNLGLRFKERASATAVAFGMGMFSGQKEGRHQPFAVIIESRANDIMLRFHDRCQNYRGEGVVIMIQSGHKEGKDPEYIKKQEHNDSICT
ncbi:hypothetical protein L2E82_43062 [Cichorium intybus]|uniref:Uncharacterized protein n=1 Tax=Cichorium intybus TaxID=13427 RepID=A0ACB8ZM56_CICIN|nr:hypothetical protein L2E82_43062 [Cichorium intybus]